MWGERGGNKENIASFFSLFCPRAKKESSNTHTQLESKELQKGNCVENVIFPIKIHVIWPLGVGFKWRY